MPSTTTAAASSPKLAALGFCGADDSVNHRHLILLGKSYPTIEWGILFRPDKEGQPRYATRQWVCRLAELLRQNDVANAPPPIRLAAHLCESHVNNLLSSSTDTSCANNIDTFLNELYNWGFRRVQVNATAVNGEALPENIVFLHDESKGGIKPVNVGKVAQDTIKACQESGGK
eukprot:scaffold657_cov88-Skeletonema_marinoi.AAC.1